MLLLLSLCPSDIVPAHETADKLLICNSKKCKSKAAAVSCVFSAKCIVVVAKRTKTAQRRQQCRQTIHLDVKKIQQVGIEGMQEHMRITQLAPIIILFGKEFNKESINSPGSQEMRRLVYSLTLSQETKYVEQTPFHFLSSSHRQCDIIFLIVNRQGLSPISLGAQAG